MSTCTDEQLDCFLHEFKHFRSVSELNSCVQVLKNYQLTKSQRQRAETAYRATKKKLKGVNS